MGCHASSVETLDEDYRVSMIEEESEHKAYGFWVLFENFNKDLKRVNVKKLLLSALTSAAPIMDRNSQK